MAGGEAGAALPILVLMVLNLVVLTVWVARGPGKKNVRFIISTGAIVLLGASIFIALTAESISAVRNVALLAALFLPILFLFIPVIYKRGLRREDT